MAETHSIPGLVEAQAERDAALAVRCALDQQHATANESVKAAEKQRVAIVRRIAAGEEVNAAESCAATEAIATTTAHTKMLADALAEHDSASDRASLKVARILERQGYKDLAAAVEIRLDLAEKGDALGAAMMAWLSEWKANEGDIHAALGAARSAGALIPAEDLGNMRVAASFVPSPFQQSIVTTGSIVAYSLSERIQNGWKRVLDDARRRSVEAI